MITRFAGPFAAFVFLSVPGHAQTQPGSPAVDAPVMQAFPDAEERAPDPVKEFETTQASGELLATDLVGQTLHDPSDRDVGTIADILFDDEGRLSLVVVDVGNYLGAEKKVAFAFDALAYRTVDKDIHLVANVAREDLTEAPSFVSLADEAQLGDMQGLTREESQPAPGPSN